MTVNEGTQTAAYHSDAGRGDGYKTANANGDSGISEPPAYRSHPLGPLSAQEITQGADLIKASWPAGTDCHFKAVTLQEPAKAELVPYLNAERVGQTPTDIDRRAFVVYYFRGTVCCHPSREAPLPC